MQEFRTFASNYRSIATMHEIWALVNEMSPYLLLGFAFAGLLHSFVPASLYRRYLGKNSFSSVIWAALLGVPLPLCSCGVIPTAMSLRKEGASKGATTSFLIATPQTGVDSILATASLLGVPFAILRPVAALVTALFGGGVVTMATRNEPNEAIQKQAEDKPKLSFWQKCLEALRYGFVDMIQDIGRWLVLGLVIAGLITVFVPDDFFLRFADTPESPTPFTIATGTSAAPYLTELVERAKKQFPAISGQVVGIVNDFFGHTIDVAGLVTGQDLCAQLKGRDLGERVLIPISMLRHGENVFLDDYTVPQLEKELGCRVEVIGGDGGDLLDAILA